MTGSQAQVMALAFSKRSWVPGAGIMIRECRVVIMIGVQRFFFAKSGNSEIWAWRQVSCGTHQRRAKADLAQQTRRGRVDRMTQIIGDMEIRILDQILEQLGHRHHGDPLVTNVAVDGDGIQFVRQQPIPELRK